MTTIVSMIVNGQATAFERARRFVRSAGDEWTLATDGVPCVAWASQTLPPASLTLLTKRET